jgi:hypothetical protein
MKKLLHSVFIYLTFTSFAVGQTEDSTKANRCNQYSQILKFISDTSNIKFYKEYGVDFKEIKVSSYYRHFAMRQNVRYSFKHYLRDTSASYKTISEERNSSIDSTIYSEDLKDSKCISFNNNSISRPNLSVFFDRYSNNIIFVLTRYLRKGYSFGLTYIFWFDKSGKFTYEQMGFIE